MSDLEEIKKADIPLSTTIEKECPRCGCPFWTSLGNKTLELAAAWKDENGQWFRGPSKEDIRSTCACCGWLQVIHYSRGKLVNVEKEVSFRYVPVIPSSSETDLKSLDEKKKIEPQSEGDVYLDWLNSLFALVDNARPGPWDVNARAFVYRGNCVYNWFGTENEDYLKAFSPKRTLLLLKIVRAAVLLYRRTNVSVGPNGPNFFTDPREIREIFNVVANLFHEEIEGKLLPGVVCPRCGKGRDTDGDGDCPLCGPHQLGKKKSELERTDQLGVH